MVPIQHWKELKTSPASLHISRGLNKGYGCTSKHANLAVTAFLVLEYGREMVRYNRTIDLNSRDLSQKKIDNIISFVHSLTSILALPESVPSKFQIDHVSEHAAN